MSDKTKGVYLTGGYISTGADDESAISKITTAVAPISAVACAYHGYKRTKSAAWALGWAAFGAIAPLVAPVIAVAEGFGKPKSGG